MSGARPIEVTEVILRDAHQSLIATRMRTEDMLPICEQLDAVGSGHLKSGVAPHSTPASGFSRKIRGAVEAAASRTAQYPAKCCCAARTCWAIVTMQTMSLRVSSRSQQRTALMYFVS